MAFCVLLRWLTGAVIALSLPLFLAACGGGGPPASQAANGVLNLSAWDFPRDGVASLDGQWRFHWGSFDDPAAPAPASAPQTLAPVPGPWNDLPAAAGAAGSLGIATYRLRVDCGNASGLALALPVQHSAAAWYVNGRRVARQGMAGTTPETATPAPVQQIVHLDGLACPMDIVVHVSNFDVRRGGLMRSVTLGTRQQIREERERALTRDVFALGGLTFMGGLPLVFWLLRRKDPTPMYFGLFCLTVALGLSLSGTRVLQPLVAPLGWDAYFRLTFFCWYLSMGCFALFLRSLYPGEFHRIALRIIVVWIGLSLAVVLVTPARIFSYLVPSLQGGAALTAVYMIVTLVRAFRAGRRSAGVLLAGFAVLVVASVHDNLQYEHLQRLALVPYGLFAFVIAPAILLARRFSRALTAEELHSIEQRERADLIVRATKAGVLDWDAASGKTTYSDRYREMLGYASGPDAPEPPPFRQLVHPEDHDKVHGSFMKQLRDLSVASGVRANEPMDYRMRRADGEYLWIHAEAISVCGANGRTLRFICSLIDITQAKRHETEMSNRIKFINDLFDSVPLALSMRGLDGRYVFANRTWERYYGQSREEVIGRSVRDYLSPAECEGVEALDRAALERGPDNPLFTPDAPFRERDYTQTRTVMSNARNEALGVVIATQDVTEQRSIERALATEQKRIELVVRAAKAGIVDWNGLTRTGWYSPRLREILGYPAHADTSGWPDYFEMIHPEDAARVAREFKRHVTAKREPGELAYHDRIEYRLRRADGSYVWVQGMGVSQSNTQGYTVQFIASITDISERRAQDEALRASHDQIAAQAALLERQNEALKENVRLREEVERIGRHDIKTPLNSIVAVPRLLREERKLGPEADELLGIVERAGYRILSMVNLSLDLFKMEQGTYVFRPDAVDLADLANKVAADVRMHAASKQVLLKLDMGHVPYAWAEELLCYSLLANLLKNAVEASPEGEVVTLSAQAADEGALVIRIHNMGVVPDTVRANFFQKYATGGKASGTGLGTYSARLMARVQDGDIAMETSAENGTTLSVTLRAAPAGAVPATVRHAAEQRGEHPALISSLPAMRVLLVDDDEYNLLIVRRFLPDPPFTVDTAINGKVALACAELQWPDVVFMDLDMPVMGGLQAVQELRALERAMLAKRCTMVALSSHEDDETRARALAAGFDRYLTKPVTRDAIHDTLLELNVLVGRTDAAPSARRADAIARAARMDDPVVADADVEPVLPEFMQSRRELIGAMELAMQAGNRGEVRRIAHQLAGSFGLYGFQWASDQSRWIEKNFSEVEAAWLARLAGEMRQHLDRVEVRFAPASAESSP